MYPQRITRTVTIASSGTVSGAEEYGDLTLVGLVKPATTGDALTFHGSIDGTTFSVIHYESGAYTVTVPTAACHVALNPNVFWPFKYVKVVSDVVEASARTLTLIFQPYGID